MIGKDLRCLNVNPKVTLVILLRRATASNGLSWLVCLCRCVNSARLQYPPQNLSVQSDFELLEGYADSAAPRVGLAFHSSHYELEPDNNAPHIQKPSEPSVFVSTLRLRPNELSLTKALAATRPSHELLQRSVLLISPILLVYINPPANPINETNRMKATVAMLTLRNIAMALLVTTAIAGKHKPTCDDCKIRVAPCMVARRIYSSQVYLSE
jgi:hypothetical protein